MVSPHATDANAFFGVPSRQMPNMSADSVATAPLTSVSKN
ncbi:unnamed protein product [Enterobius vermicularis]|uniref:Uncharacterized protein n=1 Tax=Enterobius vermicularis TaxID=51028 RepID=A0A0N4V8H4_ENTVE|nr:unnamed protein product [Enterobius vermicularis]